MPIVVVTGGAGFIGSHLVATLVAQGHQVRVLDDLSTGHEENLAPVRDVVQFTCGSVTDLDECRRICDGADFVAHLAAFSSVPGSVSDPLRINATNTTGTVNVLWAAHETRVQRVVFTSSCSVYGRTQTVPLRTDMRPVPISPYAVTKLASEHYLSAFYECYGLETASLRLFNVYGPGQRLDGQYAAVIPRFIKAMLAQQPVCIEGDGEQTRDFIYVKDSVTAMVAALTAPDVVGQVLNVAGGESISINELYNTLSRLLDCGVKPNYVAARKGDIKHSRADISETTTALGVSPGYTLKSGLAETLAWYRRGPAREARRNA